MIGRCVRQIGGQCQARLEIRLVKQYPLIPDLKCLGSNKDIFARFGRTTDFEISAAVGYALTHSYSTKVPNLNRDIARWFSLGSENRPVEELWTSGIGNLSNRIKAQQKKKEK